ncbi:MAG: DJ-1/PfpI family protein [Proteobacteria bacterium]|nr:DJ-1/PfpI family protein [Pseudomonadota bacterium]
MANVLVPIPATDFDPTEVAIPWRILTARRHTVTFATPNGKAGNADALMVTGRGLDLWGFIPGLRNLVLVGGVLRANADARAAYSALAASPEFREPQRWADVRSDSFDGVIFPGGHRARGMRAYLESPVVQQMALDFARDAKPIGAICHGVLVLARSRDPETGHSPLFGRKVTALTWAFERSAASLAGVTRFWDPHYYRTYREERGQAAGHMSVQAEVTRALQSPSDFKDVPADDPQFKRKSSGLVRDSVGDDTPAWVVRDGNLITARWPGDAHAFAAQFEDLIEQSEGHRP